MYTEAQDLVEVDLWLCLTYLVLIEVPDSSVVNNLPANAGDSGDVGSIPVWGDLLEKEMATHSSILTWEIPWTEEPAELLSLVLQKVRHN